MTDETRVRFLAAIAKQIPPERVIEVHLFPSIKQGGAESGVAVIAVERNEEPSLDVDGGYVGKSDVAEPAEMDTTESVIVHDQLSDEAAYVADEMLPETVDESSEKASAEISEEAVEELPVVEVNLPSIELPPSRYTIFSARYRHTLKGIDRGKWEVSVTEEADAPLLTVDAVVRGVQRRSGDADETLRLSGDEFRAMLPVSAQG